jgi:hypothetical protein
MIPWRRRLMNIFGLSLEEIQAEAKPLEEPFDLLPGAPAFLSPTETAFILNVSLQTVSRMIGNGDLKPNREGDILKSDVVEYIRGHALADRPVLEEE